MPDIALKSLPMLAPFCDLLCIREEVTCLLPILLPPVRDQRTLTRFDRLDQEAPAQTVSNIVDGR